MQSVCKLVVVLALLDAVDRHQFLLEDSVTVHRQDLSLYVQPLGKLTGPGGYQTTIGDLARRDIVDSDSAASDILMRKLGGPRQVQAFLERKAIQGVHIDRDERHLQTEIAGLEWRPEYTDPAILEHAIAAVPPLRRAEAYRRYQADPRDTATPQGMTQLLYKLAIGKILSPVSTHYLLQVMTQTVTFPDRLKAGVPPGWALAHKTGTSSSWHGLTAATNDVGILTAPGGGSVAIAVFLGDARASSQVRAALTARLAATTIEAYR